MVREQIRTDTIARLDEYYADALGCETRVLGEPGVHLIATRLRTRPGWAGYTKPLYAVAREKSLAVSFSPDLERAVRAELMQAPNGSTTLWAEFDRLRRISQRATPYAFILSGHSMYCDPAFFRPIQSPTVQLARDDARGRDLRSRFDGEIFAAFGPRGEVASWAAIKLKSDHIWEIAVVTEPQHRGRGLARQVVSAATAYILEQGRLALYIFDRSNLPSGKVCRSLGYQEYAHEFFAEY